MALWILAIAAATACSQQGLLLLLLRRLTTWWATWKATACHLAVAILWRISAHISQMLPAIAFIA
jgi:hypothetical protein